MGESMETVQIRVDRDLLDWIDIVASKDGRSRSGFIRKILSDFRDARRDIPPQPSQAASS